MRRHNRQDGAGLVELAVTLLVFFPIVMGIYEFGRAFNMYQVLTNAAREGARYSVAPLEGTSSLPSVSNVQSHVQTFLAPANMGGTSVSVNQTLPVTVNGLSIVYTQVQVTAPYQFLFFPFGTINLTATSEMRNETN